MMFLGARRARSPGPLVRDVVRVEFVVSATHGGWRVSRGHTSPMDYPTLERAVGAAVNFARMAAERGDRALVRIMAGDAIETRRFEPEAMRPVEVRRTAAPAANPSSI